MLQVDNKVIYKGILLVDGCCSVCWSVRAVFLLRTLTPIQHLNWPLFHSISNVMAKLHK